MSNPNPSSWDPDQEPATEAPRGLVREFLTFLWENKLWWMTPTVLILILLGIVIYRAQESNVAPFIYSLF